MDRVALIAVVWFLGWVAAGSALARLMFSAPMSGGIWGFVLALLSVFLWPWLLPRSVDDWMHSSHR